MPTREEVCKMLTDDGITAPDGFLDFIFSENPTLSTLEDNWEHRNDNMKCSTCMWFILKKPIHPKKSIEERIFSVGRCHRHAPIMNGYPAVFLGDWCGDHKIDEKKV